MEKVYKFIDKITPQNYLIKLILISILCVIISILCNVLISYFFELEIINNSKTITIIKKIKIIHFLIIVIIGPLTETFLFQWLPVYFFKEFKESKKTDFKFVLLFSLAFGLLHSYSAGYQISGFVIGFIYLTLTMYYADKKQNFYFPIVVIHVFNNLIAFITSNR